MEKNHFSDIGSKMGVNISSDSSSDSGTAALRPLRLWHQNNLFVK